jgi:hypothetical protein
VHRLIQELDSEDLKNRVGLALRWYGLGLGQHDVTLEFLSFWIALESLGEYLSKVFHTNGAKAGCKVCGTQPGIKQDRARSGMEHVIKLTSDKPELFTLLMKARANMFHGLKDIHEISSSLTRNNVNAIRNAVCQSILTLITPKGDLHSTDVLEPSKEIVHAPRVSISATLIAVSDEERVRILYSDPVDVQYEQMQNAAVIDDESAMLGCSISLEMPFDTQGRVVDIKTKHFSPADIQLKFKSVSVSRE